MLQPPERAVGRRGRRVVRLGEPVNRRMLEGGGGGRHVKADCWVVPSGGFGQVTGGGQSVAGLTSFPFRDTV